MIQTDKDKLSVFEAKVSHYEGLYGRHSANNFCLIPGYVPVLLIGLLFFGWIPIALAWGGFWPWLFGGAVAVVGNIAGHRMNQSCPWLSRREYCDRCDRPYEHYNL